MNDLSSQETKSYQDPLGDAGFTSLIEPPPKEAAETPLDLPSDEQQPDSEPDTEDLPPDSPPESAADTSHPEVDECYRGFYSRFTPAGEEGRRFIVGIEGIVSSIVPTRANGDKRELLGMDGRVVATVSGSAIAELNSLESMGWQVECRMALSVYDTNERQFQGDVAWLAFDSTKPEVQTALAEFVKGITTRIALGSRPELQLDQGQFVRVLESKGRWYLTKDTSIPRLPVGTMIHRQRRSLSEGLIHTALNHRMGCNVATWVFLVATLIVLYILFVK
ncbi:MAG: hypothetical protein FWH40_02390 [Coriobacteriia bacterium]|nr:hypothetical protein [Coriobacteriia bacterium]